MCLARAYSRQVDVEVSACLVYEYFLRHFRPTSAVATALVFEDTPYLPEAYSACRYLGQVDGDAVGNVSAYQIGHDNKRVALDERQQYMPEVVRLKFMRVRVYFVRVRFGGSARQRPRSIAVRENY